MQYLLLIYTNENAMLNAPKEAATQMISAYQAYTEAMTKAGGRVGRNRLRPTSEPTTVRALEAWLLTVARRKLIDAARRRRTSDDAVDVIELLAEAQPEAEIPDERLRLMFACAHPAIDEGVRAPLILQVVLGFDAAAIASAFLVAPATMGQRLVRAKSRIRQTGIPFSVPGR